METELFRADIRTDMTKLIDAFRNFSIVSKGGSTLVTLPRIVTPYRDSVDGTRDRVTYQKLVTRQCYELVRCAVGIWPTFDMLRGHESRPHCHDKVLRYAVTLQVFTHPKRLSFPVTILEVPERG